MDQYDGVHDGIVKHDHKFNLTFCEYAHFHQ